MEVAFKSLGGRDANQGLILRSLDKLADRLAPTTACTIQIMCFAFTDKIIAAKLVDLAKTKPALKIEIIADWSQRSAASASILPDLVAANIPNIIVKYKIDFPYRLSRKTGQPEWDYLASCGMLHHKTMLVCVEDQPNFLTFGSYNWSARGCDAYENTVLLEQNSQTSSVLDSFRAEFLGLWNDPTQTTSPTNATKLASRARAMLVAGANLKDPESLNRLLGEFDRPKFDPQKSTLCSEQIIPAFSAKHILEEKPTRGAGIENAHKKIDLIRPNGKRKPAPLTLNTLALEAIRGVPDGEEICIAMYAMSPRVPEYECLLEAARRGCTLKVILDQTIGGGFAGELAKKAHVENLPILVKATHRRMHQKYLLCNATRTVAVGTANMTRDATFRHFENRVLFQDMPEISDKFREDFETIWARIP